MAQLVHRVLVVGHVYAAAAANATGLRWAVYVLDWGTIGGVGVAEDAVSVGDGMASGGPHACKEAMNDLEMTET